MKEERYSTLILILTILTAVFVTSLAQAEDYVVLNRFKTVSTVASTAT